MLGGVGCYGRDLWLTKLVVNKTCGLQNLWFTKLVVYKTLAYPERVALL